MLENLTSILTGASTLFNLGELGNASRQPDKFSGMMRASSSLFSLTNTAAIGLASQGVDRLSSKREFDDDALKQIQASIAMMDATDKGHAVTHTADAARRVVAPRGLGDALAMPLNLGELTKAAGLGNIATMAFEHVGADRLGAMTNTPLPFDLRTMLTMLNK